MSHMRKLSSHVDKRMQLEQHNIKWTTCEHARAKFGLNVNPHFLVLGVSFSRSMGKLSVHVSSIFFFAVDHYLSRAVLQRPEHGFQEQAGVVRGEGDEA